MVATSELESNIRLATQILTKTKKMFLYFDNSHANQANLTKKNFFIHCQHQRKSKED